MARNITSLLDSMEAQNSNGVVGVTSTARIKRAHSDRACSASKEVILTTLFSFLLPQKNGKVVCAGRLGWALLARVERAPSERARSASKEPT